MNGPHLTCHWRYIIQPPRMIEHTQTTKPQHGGTHTDLRLNPLALDIYPSHPVIRCSQTTAGAPGFSGKCSATFLHYLLGLILRPVLGINIQLYFLGSHISVFSWSNTSVFVFRTGSTSFQWAFHTIWPIFNDFDWSEMPSCCWMHFQAHMSLWYLIIV